MIPPTLIKYWYAEPPHRRENIERRWGILVTVGMLRWLLDANDRHSSYWEVSRLMLAAG